MNRQERRRAEREGKKTPHILTKITTDEYMKTLEERHYRATKEAVQVMTAIMAISLNNEYGFSTKRIQRLIDRMRLQFERIAEKTLEPEDLMKWCEEHNIELI